MKLAEALAKAQAEMKAAPLNKVNPHFKSKYADLPAVIDAVRPALTRHGLSVTQTMRLTEAGMILVTTLHHTSGETVESLYPLPIGKPQEMGSAITYARRYSLAALCCIAADEDDDANAYEDGGQPASKPKAAPKPAPAPAAPPPDASAPALIPVPTGDNGADWLAWGGQFTAVIRACKTAEQIMAWQEANAAPLKNLRATGPAKIASRVDTVLSECRTNAPSEKEAA